MTLCIVWRSSDGNVHFASDSRLSFETVRCDAAIKICRVPYTIYDAAGPGERAPVESSGDLGMAFSGSSSVALMTKEALAEIVRDLQGIRHVHDMDMDGIADVMRRGFRVICNNISQALFEKVATCVVFAGQCKSQGRVRVFEMSVDSTNTHSFSEILPNNGDFTAFGSGRGFAQRKLAGISSPSQKDFLIVLKSVIDDPSVEDVGGSIQYGNFKNGSFQPAGVAMLGNTPQGVHYWRGPLDLNGSDFDQAAGLFPRFPYLDLFELDPSSDADEADE
jgi:hypothetical protein